MRSKLVWKLVIAVAAWRTACAVDASKFRTCEQGSFCRRYRKHIRRIQASKEKVFQELIIDTLSLVDSHGVRVHLKTGNRPDVAPLDLQVLFYKDSWRGACGIVRTIIDETEPLYPRFRPRAGDVVVETLTPDSVSVTSDQANTRISSKSGDCSAILQHSPFTIVVKANGRELQRFNGRSLLNFERYRTRKSAGALGLTDATSADAEGLWEEAFDGHIDSKARGPASVGIDIAFADATIGAGLAEHASALDLASAKYKEPFRLYNLDVFEYETDTPMALYGSVPILLGVHVGTPYSASGVFIPNPSECFVKVANSSTALDTWWIFESGILDMFSFVGPDIDAVLQQYHSVTGTPRMPPIFALGKHQSRWNYIDITDAQGVMKSFDKHRIPFDVLWLDLEHTDGKKYFTWDPDHFGNATQLISSLADTGRRLVTIVDPHIKTEPGYRVYDLLNQGASFTKAANKSTYQGFCWPGTSSYPDFCNPATRELWSKLFSAEVYPHSGHNLFTWNDMNEPSVFDGPEVTMPRDNVHHCGSMEAEHRDMHNLFGMYVHAATVEGQLRRSPKQRPFVLTRSFFAGSHRHGAAWTGDNTASWEHLEYSVPMLLSLCLSGYSFVGADVPGFFNDPEPELFLRWHQLGIWYPLYRGHAHLTTKRREPWLFGDTMTSRIKKAVVGRYRLLPYWYTLYAEWALLARPILRPIWYSDLTLVSSLSHIDKEFMVGDAIMVAAVTRPGTKGLEIHLPSGAWFPFWDNRGAPLQGTSQPQRVRVTNDHIPAYVRQGSILPLKARPRRSTAAMSKDPYTLAVYGDQAKGSVYADDGESFAYLHGAFIYDGIVFDGTQLQLKANALPLRADAAPGQQLQVSPEAAPALPRIERVLFIGLSSRPSSAWLVIHAGEESSRTKLSIKVETLKGSSALWLVTVKNPGVAFGNYSWSLRLEQ